VRASKGCLHAVAIDAPIIEALKVRIRRLAELVAAIRDSGIQGFPLLHLRANVFGAARAQSASFTFGQRGAEGL
jgi:hypothetical protein